jgi:heterodisulfide reductase subunit A
MVAASQHPNIKLITYAEVVKVTGYIGNFNVTIKKRPKYVDWDACTGCGTCIDKCPTKKLKDEFDLGLGLRTAIHKLFPPGFGQNMALPGNPALLFPRP